MNRQTNNQLELFSYTLDANQYKHTRANNVFLSRMRNHEKKILIIMGMVVTGIISFSLGIEKGKSVILSKTQSKPLNIEKQATTEDKAKINRLIREESTTYKETAPQDNQYYVIQLASYKDKSLAQKEALQLKKKGFASLVIPKGSYAVLCVGNFSNKAAALSLQSELKKQYKDCYIRRL